MRTLSCALVTLDTSQKVCVGESFDMHLSLCAVKEDVRNMKNCCFWVSGLISEKMRSSYKYFVNFSSFAVQLVAEIGIRLIITEEYSEPSRTVTMWVFAKIVNGWKALRVHSCKLYNKKNMVASTKITNTEIFSFIAALVFKLLNRKVLFINRKDNRNC